MKKIYWQLPDGKIAVTMLIDETVSLDRVKPDVSAILIDPKYLSSLPPGNVETWKFIPNKGLVSDTQAVESNLWKKVRDIRDEKLKQSDVYIIRLVELGGNLEPVKRYRQALRDITLQNDPENIDWPLIPNISS